MALTINSDTVVINGTLHAGTSALLDYKVPAGPYFTGDDNRLYMVTNSGVNSTDPVIYRVDTFGNSRVSTFVLSAAFYQPIITAKSGLVKPSASSIYVVAVLQPTNYLLIAQNSLGGDGTVFAICKVDKSSNFVCEGAVRFQHSSSNAYLMYGVNCAGLTGDCNEGSAIFLSYGHNFASGPYHFRGWRLPSIDKIRSDNGTSYSSSVMTANNKDMSAGWSSRFGYQTLAPTSASAVSARTQRKGSGFGWLGTVGNNTRMYFYVGKNDVVNAPVDSSDYIYQQSLTYGNQYLAYIDLGNVSFSTSSGWSESFNRTVDNSLLKASDGVTNLLPFTLYNADGTTVDTNGYGDFSPYGSEQYLSDGTRLITLSAGPQSYSVDQYSGSSYDDLVRWITFKYNSTTGVHTLVSKGTLKPCNQVQMTNGTFVSGVLPYHTDFYYDEVTKKVFYTITQAMVDFGSPFYPREGWGYMAGPIELAPGAAFLVEADTSYNDFVAKYP